MPTDRLDVTRIALLGPLVVERGGVDLTPRSAVQRRLISVLALRAPEQASVDQLMDAAWPNGDLPKAPRENLHTHVSRLRRLLGDELETTAGGYRLSTSRSHVDIAKLDEVAAGALGAPEHPSTIEQLDDALALWRGPSLFDIADTDIGRGEAARLDELRLTMLEARFAWYAAHGNGTEILHDLEAFTVQHPYRERPHGLLMKLFDSLGRQAEALQTYKRLRDTLIEELGIEPSAQLQALEADILAQRLPEGPPLEVATTDRRDRSTVPAPASSLIGRSDLLSALDAAVGRSRLITLVGPGGVGKTRLAIEAGRRWEDTADQREAIVWVDLTAAADRDDVLEISALALQAQREPHQTPLDAIVAAAALNGEPILILDNCERVVDAVAELVEAVLGAAPLVRVVTTSRSPIDLPAEVLFELAPLRYEQPPQPPPMSASTDVAPHRTLAPAVELFIQRADAAGVVVADSDDALRLVENICRSVDGLPLGIELAAAQLRSLTLTDLDERIKTEINALHLSRRRGLERHRSIRTALDWTYQTLTSAQQQLFTSLSVFAGSFDVHGATAVVGPSENDDDITAGLRELTDLSLLRADRTGARTRFRLLGTARAYGRGLLAERDRGALHTARHDDWVRRFVEARRWELRTPDESDAVRAINEELDNVRAAHRRAVSNGDTDAALSICCSLGEFAIHRIRDDIIEWTERSISLSDAANHPRFAHAEAVLALGLTNRGDLGRAGDLAARSIAGASTDPAAAAAAHHAQALVGLYSGRLDLALHHAGAALQIATDAGDAMNAVHACLVSSLACLYDGEPLDARRWAELCAQHATASGAPTAKAWSAYAQGEVSRPDDIERAVGYFEEAIAMGDSVESNLVTGVSRVSLAALRSTDSGLSSSETGHGPARQDDHASLSTFNELVSRWERLGNGTHQWTTLQNLAPLLLRAGRHEEAAVVTGALTAEDALRPLFGDAADTMRELEQRLTTELGEAGFRHHARHGATMRRNDLVAFVLAATQQAAT